mmetsp:Transcript_21035/g.54305  ORF Transcript_21035/g.54305 Transcript_21035/m.54305 type:complete len:176 (+) Transcript_21035:3-530(+)
MFYVPAKMRATFYKYKTWGMHLDTYYWDDKLFDRYDGIELRGHEAVRANLPMWNSEIYLPRKKLKTLYKARWVAWEHALPDWFTVKFQGDHGIPDALVPGIVLKARTKQREIARAKRRKSLANRLLTGSRRPSWMTNDKSSRRSSRRNERQEGGDQQKSGTEFGAPLPAAARPPS